MERLAGEYLALTSDVDAAPGRPLSRAALLPEPQVPRWNSPTGRPSACRLIWARAKRSRGTRPSGRGRSRSIPPRERLTYDQLDRTVAVVARRLVAQGVRAGQPVAVCADRGAEVVIALLALLEIGAVYVPNRPGPSAAAAPRGAGPGRARLVLADTATRALPVGDGVAQYRA